MPNKLILCDCCETQSIDVKGLSRATGLACSKLHSALCTTQSAEAAKAVSDPDAIICCTQEQQYFEELAAELDVPSPAFVDLRDRAGWSDDTRSSLPKMAALVAEATLPMPTEKTFDVVSEGLCLILGKGEVAFEAAEKLKDILSVTVLMSDKAELPTTRAYDVVQGRLTKAQGILGQFEVSIDALRQVQPGGKGAYTLSEPRDGGCSECDIILDLTGGTPLFPAPDKRDGYLRADPGSQTAVADAILQASQLVGTFEKPLYVRLDTMLCAHSRAGQIGCSNCLDICPTGAIAPDGDHISIDPMICAGCGACSSLCPSGAISYDAPPVDMIIRRVQTLAASYLEAGGQTPRLLVVDDHGAEMIRLAARFGRGLPADVLPLEIGALNAFGHAEILAGLAAGFASVCILLAPKTERDVLEREVTLARALGGDTVELLDISDPDLLVETLFNETPKAAGVDVVRPVGSRRQIARQSAKALNPDTQILNLPENAPYGAVKVDTDACTLCLSCVSLCPSGALGDNPDKPQLRFQEDACLQCGLCANACPENAITYAPRMNLTDDALKQVVLHEEEPFACVECGGLFGVKSTIEKITEKLVGSHTMYKNEQAARMIQMCDNCRVNAQFHSQNNPFESKDRPRVRTTEDYLSKRRDH